MPATYAEVLAHTCALVGLPDPAEQALDALSARTLNRILSRRLAYLWQMGWWPETTRAQLRYYRADYASGTTYAAADEVYYPTTGAYYRATQSTTGNVPTNTTYWSANPSDFDPYVALAQTGEDAIGIVRYVGLDDPTGDVSPRRLPWVMTQRGVEILGDTVPTSVYLWFQVPAPAMRGDTFSATATYAAGRVVYYSSTTAGFEGDYYTCLATTTAGQDPEDTPAKWQKQEIPTYLREPLSHYAAADWLRFKREVDTAAAEEAAAEAVLARTIRSFGIAEPFARTHSAA